MISEIFMAVFLIFSPTMITIHPQPDAFNTSSVGGLESFLQWSAVNDTMYDYDAYNCVNFSSDLISELEYYGFESSNAIMHKENGTKITDDMHMIVAVKLDDKIIFVEPQSDTILRYNELEQHYSENRFTDIVIYDLIGEWMSWKFNGYLSNNSKNTFEVELWGN